MTSVRSVQLLNQAAVCIGMMLGIFGLSGSVQAQQKATSLQHSAFSEAEVQWNGDAQMPEDIKMELNSQLSKEGFFNALRSTFQLPDELQFITVEKFTEPGGYQHIRHTLRYKNIELAETQFILHLKDRRVLHAHGKLPDLQNVGVTPSISRQEAYTSACNHLGISEYEAKINSNLLSNLSGGQEERREDGRLLLSSGLTGKPERMYKLAYRFDMTVTDPLQRYNVDIDAHTGELVGKYPTLFHENIPTKGMSLYYDTVDIIVSDSSSLEEWDNQYTHWHLDEWNAYQDTGKSWWMADTTLVTPGGYDNNWREALVTDPIILSGPEPRLEFVHRYNLELPDGASDYDEKFDGWDGINVRISRDDGNTWIVLAEPEPAYTCNSLWSFGGIHNEGPGIPGWAGEEVTWTQVHIDLSEYSEDTVLIRFDFAADGGFSSLDDNSLFGWQIDDILVMSDSVFLFSNSGNDSNMNVQNLFQWVGSIEGEFRLRETTRGNGIATINARSGEGFATYVDYVQEILPYSNEENMAGVGVHWATEKTYDYFFETFNRNSYDNKGGAIVSYSDWMRGDDQFNAFWAGNFAAYGAGGDETGSFGTIDVVGHEITHGVTQYSATLTYQGESGALNESFSDIFGTAIEFYVEGKEKGDWLIGEDIYGGQRAIRSMEDPKRFSDPDTSLGQFWIDTEEEDDFGGVHTNNGVQNHWFYLLSEGGTGENDDNFTFEVAGIGLEDASSIAYRNLTLYLVPESRYKDAVLYSIQSAEDLFGENSPQVESTMAAWEAAGIYMNYPLLAISDSVIEFETPPGTSDSLTISLHNKGLLPLTISEFNLSDPAHYSLVNPPAVPFDIDGLDNIRLEVRFTPDSVGIYPGTFTIISGTDSGDLEKTIDLAGKGIDSSTGLPPEFNATSAEFSLYPNPVSSMLTIETNISDLYKIEVFTLKGQLLFNEEMVGNSHELDLSPLRKGIYFITIRSAESVITRKIVKLK